ncbi:hypothetical protein Angca_009249 [Angiostrongylus cantonensis]|nr:hypothetical protein Angca_009249 [Angiostrongylus cantonensis]
MELGDANESQLDESLDGANTAADEEEIDESILDQEIEVEESSDSQSDTQSETSLSSSSTTEMKEENSNCALNTDSEENPTQNGNVAPKRAQRMRSSRRPQSQRHGSEEGNVEKDEDMDVDHKAMLSSADRKIQVGDDFQAHVDETQKIEQESQMTGEEREQVLWCPPGNINENKLIEFCEDAVGVYKISYDRALYILQKSNFDFNVAREKLKRRRLVAEEWSDDDRTLFKQAFHMFGKRFDKIRQTMPYRSMASLIQFYYNTKKDIDYKSLFDSRMANDSDDDNSDDELDYEDGRCDNCGEECNTLHPIDEVKLCYVCRMYYKFMRKHRPCTYTSAINENRQRKQRKCPDDMQDIANSFAEMSKHVDDKPSSSDENACGGIEGVQTPKTKCHDETRAVTRELVRTRSRVVRLESMLREQRINGLLDGLDEYRPLAAKEDKKDEEGSSRRDRVRGSHTWTEEERIIAFHCLIRYRRDFDAVAEILGTKTSDKVKSFYTEMKEDIDKLLEKEADLEAEMVKSFDVDKELNIEPPKTVEVVNLE